MIGVYLPWQIHQTSFSLAFALQLLQSKIGDFPFAEEDVAQVDIGIQLEGGEIVGTDQAEEAGAEGIVFVVDHQRAATGEDIEDLPEIPPVQDVAFLIVHRAFVVSAQHGDRQIGGKKIHCFEKNAFLIHSDMLPMRFDWRNCTTRTRVFQPFPEWTVLIFFMRHFIFKKKRSYFSYLWYVFLRNLSME